jgi:NTE family protein
MNGGGDANVLEAVYPTQTWPEIDEDEREEEKKVAFVLGGGGSRGAVQVGMVRYLFEHGVRPDIVTGVSIGALNGFFIAQDKIEELERHWRNVKKNDDVYRPRFLAGLLMYLGWQWGYPSLYKPGPVARALSRSIRHRHPDHFKSELRVGAVDLVSGNYVSVNQHHPLLHRFLNGCTAIPMVLPPIRIKCREDADIAGVYVDGCVRNITPLGEAIRLGATEVHVFLTSSITLPRKPEDYGKWRQLIERMVDINLHEMFISDIERVLLLNELAARDDIIASYKPCDYDDPAPAEVDLHIYHTHDSQLQSILDFDPAAIADCIALGYELAEVPTSNAELAEGLSVDLRAIPYGHRYCDWVEGRGTVETWET